MKALHGRRRLFAALLIWASATIGPAAPGASPAQARPVGRDIEQQVLADWIECDARFPGASETSFSLDHTQAVLKRARALAKRLGSVANPAELPPRSERTKGQETRHPRLRPWLDRLDALETRLEALRALASPSLNVRSDLYFEARRTARGIAFENPRLDFDGLLFLKRHDAAGVFHMCDQFYGCNAVPGGGLYVLEDPFGAEPRLLDLLADSTVESGRLQGRTLEDGAFLSPDLSFDGGTLLFAWTEAGAWERYRGQEAYEWAPDCVYHLFRCNADGSGLVQLTDGAWNDFDPCFLPGDRVAFVSERRGGYLRCGRHCPVYTLHSMDHDGGDILRLSFHETHEWQPSVTHDGMLVYTRWDYVDRDTNIAHHLWTCFPDGRDPRTTHGNYPERRESRPWMEMNLRAVPGTHKFVATAGAHHGHAFGSLVLIDPQLSDDGALSQVRRLTPEVPFPEAEGHPIRDHMVYGTPWPLSEDDYLCVYDPAAKNRGIYWIDRFGNRELIYRDPEISCLDPIPLRPRPEPPVLPDQTADAVAAARSDSPAATVAVLNVYDSDFTWPPDTRITALRVIQVLPKTTAPPNQPRIGVAEQTNARAVLGSAPVEEDGSAFFEVPPGREIYFQALDEQGMAVQSMRSGTYLHPGEALTCQGCHEEKHRAPPSYERTPLALRRPPSPLQPDVDGSQPFSYVRLVQPVLDRHCVGCHQREGALDLSGTLGGPHGWSRSYANLAGDYGFYFHVTNGSLHTGVHGGSRTHPGAFGAKAAPLLKFLGPEHFDVELPAEDRYRMTLWLDLNSEFYGSYEDTEAQARGERVLPTLH